METNKLIVAFHIGRGGRFNNQGHVKFIGEKRIGDFIDDLFQKRENEDDLFNLIKNHPNLIKKFYECSNNDEWSFFKKRLKFDIGELIYVDGSGNPVGLTQEDVDKGVGTINIDNLYDTTYSKYLEDCNENELELIREYSGYKSFELLETI